MPKSQKVSYVTDFLLGSMAFCQKSNAFHHGLKSSDKVCGYTARVRDGASIVSKRSLEIGNKRDCSRLGGACIDHAEAPPCIGICLDGL